MSLRLTEEEYAALMARRNPSGAARHLPLTGAADPSAHAHIPSPGAADATAPAGKRGSKYGNRRVEVDGKRFDSQHEAEVYGALMLRHRAGELRLVLRQVPFDLPGGIRYFADFLIVDTAGRLEVIDAKSEATRKNRVYINKRKQMKSEWGIDIREV